MNGKKLQIKDTSLKKVLRNEGRKGARKDFFELLKRASRKGAGKS